jgi:hypothetical protein
VVAGASGNVGTSVVRALARDPEVETIVGLCRGSRAIVSIPRGRLRASFYSRHKAEVERRLDAFEGRHPEVRCVRLRPGLMGARLG